MRKYIKQIDNPNFIYPNNTLAEYDVDIVHDINNNSVTGSTSSFTATLVGSNIVISFSYNWALNDADPFIDGANLLHILSVHMMEPTTQYYKPWRMVSGVTTSSIGSTTFTGSTSITVTPAMMGVSSFSIGDYYFEVRFIGKRAVYPECETVAIIAPTPTPTATSTNTPTPTATSNVTPTPTPSNIPIFSGSGFYASTYENACSGSISGNFTGNTTSFCTSTSFTGNTFASQSTGTYFLAYSGNYQQISITFGSNVVPVTGGGCSACPSPTPTPSPTPAAPTYNYYNVTRYTCPSCTSPVTDLIARTTSPTSLTNTHYYNNGDGYVYLVNSSVGGSSYTIDLDGSASSGTNCSATCAI